MNSNLEKHFKAVGEDCKDEVRELLVGFINSVFEAQKNDPVVHTGGFIYEEPRGHFEPPIGPIYGSNEVGLVNTL